MMRSGWEITRPCGSMDMIECIGILRRVLLVHSLIITILKDDLLIDREITREWESIECNGNDSTGQNYY